MIDIVPPKRWPVFKHNSKDQWVVRDLQGSDRSPWVLTHCRAVAAAWRCRSMELEADLAQAQQQEKIYRAEVTRYRASGERDDQASTEIQRLERKCGALGRTNEDLEKRCNELRRRLSQRAVNEETSRAQVRIGEVEGERDSEKERADKAELLADQWKADEEITRGLLDDEIAKLRTDLEKAIADAPTDEMVKLAHEAMVQIEDYGMAPEYSDWWRTVNKWQALHKAQKARK